MENLTEWLRALPKVELHLHLEGTLEPEMMFDLAARNGIRLPFRDVADIRAAYEFNRLDDFLAIYYQGMSVLQQERDFFDLTFAYLQRAAADGVRHVEVFFDPQGHTSRGVPFDAVIEGVHSALETGRRTLAITSNLIMCFLRHLPEQDALHTLAQAKPHLPKLAGVGLDSSELGNPPANFQRVFAAARALGLHCVAHAGEEGPAEYVWQALDLLRVDRIDHGNRALDDPALVERLREAAMTLTVCPLSNVKLCVVKDLRDHPLRRMLEVGLRVTVNSDDPAYFGGYVLDNYLATAQALELSRTEIVTLVANSLRGSFMPPERLATLMAELDHLAAAA